MVADCLEFVASGRHHFLLEVHDFPGRRALLGELSVDYDLITVLVALECVLSAVLEKNGDLSRSSPGVRMRSWL
jgi:hypothetical protein